MSTFEYNDLFVLSQDSGRYHVYTFDIDFDLHISDGYYETNDYGEAGTRYFRGYCIDLLSNFHKEKNVTNINKLKKRIIKPDSN